MSALLYSMTVDRVMAGIRARVPEFCGMKAGDTVLDVCCGTGALSFRYASRGIISWGVDRDPAMIEYAEKRKERLEMRDIYFQTANAMDLPFEQGTFDYASISMALHEKERSSRDRVISEMRRVVKKGGNLVIMDYRVPYPRDAFGRAARLVEKMAGQDHYRCFQEFIEDGGVDALLSRNRLAEDRREHAGRLPISILKVRND